MTLIKFPIRYMPEVLTKTDKNKQIKNVKKIKKII